MSRVPECRRNYRRNKINVTEDRKTDLVKDKQLCTKDIEDE